MLDIQRARILAAMVEVAGERGAARATVAHVVGRSSVSRGTFYELFEDREDCFLAAFDDAIARIASVVVPAYERPSKWRARIRAALTALLELFDDEPGLGRLVVVESLGAGPRALERRRRALARAIAAVDEGRREGKQDVGPPPLTAEGVVGGALSVIHSRLSETKGGPLVELVGPLTSMIVLPYLGPAAARRELERPVPQAPVRPPAASPNGDPLRGLKMRLTYRTVRVLAAVAANPGSSNRAIAADAGIVDQGQISKLLARLRKLGLIENGGDAQTGTPNAWTLAPRGERVLLSISERERNTAARSYPDSSADPLLPALRAPL